MGRLRRSLLIGLPLLVVAVLLPRKAHAKKPHGHTSSRWSAATSKASRQQHIQSVVDRLRQELSIPDVVAAQIVEEDARVVSVSRADDRDKGFALRLDDDFLAQLSDDELEAVVAHELGHVWIFTHHPFLQTEEGANTVALQLVDRKTLEDVYAKVWMRVGGRGTLTYLPNSD